MARKFEDVNIFAEDGKKLLKIKRNDEHESIFVADEIMIVARDENRITIIES